MKYIVCKIEYYVNEEHPTIKDVFKGTSVLGPLDGTHPVKRVADAKIKIKAKRISDWII